jgi:hypothetical protein
MMAGRKKPIAEENPLFKHILILNFVVFLLMVGIMVLVVCLESSPATDMQKALFEVGRTVSTLIAGTFAGLAGAKAARPNYLANGLPGISAPSSRKSGGQRTT